MRRVVTLALVLVAVIHLLPVSGVLGPARLEALYGVAIADPNLLLLMRHRAILFGLLGGYLLVAAVGLAAGLVAWIRTRHSPPTG